MASPRRALPAACAMLNTNDLSARPEADQRRPARLLRHRLQRRPRRRSPRRARRRVPQDRQSQIKPPGHPCADAKGIPGRVRCRPHAGRADAAAGPPNEAAMSPFLASDIPVRATLMPGYDRKGAASVRALLHIDATSADVRARPGHRSPRMAKADVVGIVFDEWGAPPSAARRTFHRQARQPTPTTESYEAGIVYSLIVPV